MNSPVLLKGRLADLIKSNLEISTPKPKIGPTRLVIIQPTSFCNIDCSYCYVPDRNIKGVMDFEMLEKVFERLVDESMLSSRCSVVWHAGEPLTAGKRYMERAFAMAHDMLSPHCKVQLTVQTNATLIDQEWIDIFRKYNVRVGVSLDGPRWLHDRHRKDRQQRGTFDSSVRGLKKLIDAGVENYILAVVTKSTLKVAEEFYSFFADLGVADLGLIPEEVDGINLSSSLEGSIALKEFENFVDRLHEAYINNNRKPEIREFRGVREALFYTPPIDSITNNKTTAFHILTVARDGTYTTFSPELAGMQSVDGESYALGNIMYDPIRQSVETEKFKLFYSAFIKGVQLCQTDCRWFALCGGGLPSNKIAEWGRLDVAETMSCKLHIQLFASTVLGYYNQKLNIIDN